jgi:hypothetical protein
LRAHRYRSDSNDGYFADRARRDRRDAAIRLRKENERLEIIALERRRRGHGLPRWLMHNPLIYVVPQDLEPILDGSFFRTHKYTLRRLAKREGKKFTARELLARTILVWCNLRRPGGDGAGLQAPLKDAIAKACCCSPRTAYRIIEKLEARGEAHRRRRCRRFVHLSAYLGDEGKLRQFVDVHGVTYATPRAVSRTFTADGQGLWTELWKVLKRSARNLRARFSSAPAPTSNDTPYAVSTDVDSIFRAGAWVKTPAPVGNRSGADPPS